MKNRTITLDQTFTHTTASHRYNIKWTRLRCTSSPPKSQSRSKQSLIFIHGTPWSSEVWNVFARALQSTHDIYLFDHAGFGSSPAREPLDSEAQADDDLANHNARLDADHAGQAEVFAALWTSWGFSCSGSAASASSTTASQNESVEDKEEDGMPAAHVIAHDNGCLTALRAAIIHGCAFASLMLVDGVVLGPFDTGFFQTVSKQRETFLELPPTVYHGIVSSYVRAATHLPMSPEVEESLVRPWRERDSTSGSDQEGKESAGLQGSKGFWRQILQAARRDISAVQDLYAGVGACMPVCVVWGKEDQWIPVDRAQRIKDAVDARKLVIIEEAGHLVMIDQPVEFAVEVVNWLAEVA